MRLTDTQLQFADYIASLWLGEFNHRYQFQRISDFQQWVEITEYENDMQWFCSSLRNASERYAWPNRGGYSFSELSEKLCAAIVAGDENLARDCCIKIFNWGGVGRRENDRSVLRVTTDDRSIIDVVNSALDAIRNKCVEGVFDNNSILMNSAMTKVYAAADNSIPMYDGRVGAALGLLAKKFLENRDVIEVPDDLAFCWGASQGGNQNRNPSVENFYYFNELSTQGLFNQLRWARLVSDTRSILLRSLDIINQGKPVYLHVTMRDIEKALFMIGYELDAPRLNGTDDDQPARPPRNRRASRAGPTKIARAIEIYRAAPVAERTVAHMSQRFMDEIGMTHAGATTYFYNVQRIVNGESA